MRHSRFRILQRFTLPALAMLLPIGAAPSWAGDVTFDPDPGFVCDTLAVDVLVDASVTDLRGFTFVFDFDASVVTPIAVGAGALVTGAGCPNFVQWINALAIGDSISVDGATLGCSVDGPGSIIQLTFATVTHNATSGLTCRSGSLRNSLNQPIPFTCHAGLLRTCPGIGVEPQPWTRVKRLYR